MRVYLWLGILCGIIGLGSSVYGLYSGIERHSIVAIVFYSCALCFNLWIFVMLIGLFKECKILRKVKEMDKQEMVIYKGITYKKGDVFKFPHGEIEIIDYFIEERAYIGLHWKSGNDNSMDFVKRCGTKVEKAEEEQTNVKKLELQVNDLKGLNEINKNLLRMLAEMGELKDNNIKSLTEENEILRRSLTAATESNQQLQPKIDELQKTIDSLKSELKSAYKIDIKLKIGNLDLTKYIVESSYTLNLESLSDETLNNIYFGIQKPTENHIVSRIEKNHKRLTIQINHIGEPSLKNV